MPRTALWLRVFVGLLVAVLPPILLLLAAARVTESVFHSENPNLVAAVVFIGALLWAGILAIVFTGRLADEFRSFLSIAEGGTDPSTTEERTAYQRLASTLDERNRQVSALAQQSSLVPERPVAGRGVPSQPGGRSSRTRMIRLGPRRPSVSTVTPGSARSARSLLSRSASRGAVCD